MRTQTTTPTSGPTRLKPEELQVRALFWDWDKADFVPRPRGRINELVKGFGISDEAWAEIRDRLCIQELRGTDPQAIWMFCPLELMFPGYKAQTQRK